MQASAGSLDWKKLVQGTVLPSLAQFARATASCRTAFVTGSYASDRLKWCDKASHSKNLNVYFISDVDCGGRLRSELARHLRCLGDEMKRAGCQLLLDCHPYLVRPFEPTDLARLQLTTKVLDQRFAEQRYSLPPSIGTGWLLHYDVMYGYAEDMDHLKRQPSSELEWLATLHEALSRYKGVLDHLPLVADEPSVVGLEAAKYAEEAIKDCISVACTFEELVAGKQFEILADWQGRAQGFLEERLGSIGHDAFFRARALKTVAETRVHWSSEEATQALETSEEVWRHVWDAFSSRMRRKEPGMPWLVRVNAFV